MRWTPGGVSSDIEDERNNSGGGGFGIGPFGGMHLGIGGTLLLIVLGLIFKTNLFTGGGSTTGSADRQTDSGQEVQFISFVLDDVQNTWDRLLPVQAGVNYRHAKLVLYRDSYPSGCGMAQTATGPFYCPEDEKVYVDLGFFDELADRFGAPGQFAQAYVIAHEIGHHVQKLLGIEQRISRLQQAEPQEQNALSVRLELQADCLAGVWGSTTQKRNLLDPNDVPDGLRAAAAVGDDRLQRMSTGRVSPESFTHGSSDERSQWLRRGLDMGTLAVCRELTH